MEVHTPSFVASIKCKFLSLDCPCTQPTFNVMASSIIKKKNLPWKTYTLDEEINWFPAILNTFLIKKYKCFQFSPFSIHLLFDNPDG